MGIKISSKKNGSQLSIDGDLTIYEVSDYKKELKKSIKMLCPKNKVLDMDLSTVNEIDTSGLQLLATVSNQIRKKGCEINIIGSNKTIDEALNLSGLLDFFTTNYEKSVRPS